MTQIIEDQNIADGLRTVCEALRMASGFITVLAVAAIVLTSNLLTVPETDSRPRESAVTVAAPDLVATDASSIAYPVAPPKQALFVFYLVQTPQQAEIADWGEQVGASIDGDEGWRDRSYRILDAASPEEERLAGITVIDHMLAHGNVALVEVVDLRGVLASP